MPLCMVAHAHAVADAKDDVPGPEFSMQSWPCRTDVARAAIMDIIEGGEFVGQPLPVLSFTADTERVAPAHHEARLKGALVDVHVAITHEAWKVRCCAGARGCCCSWCCIGTEGRQLLRGRPLDHDSAGARLWCIGRVTAEVRAAGAGALAFR
jgi:hypothetical protein